jgi:hypothetical protein
MSEDSLKICYPAPARNKKARADQGAGVTRSRNVRISHIGVKII